MGMIGQRICSKVCVLNNTLSQKKSAVDEGRREGEEGTDDKNSLARHPLRGTAFPAKINLMSESEANICPG